ncbi:MAG: sodium:solute symporter family protein [Candidatus Methanomethylophilaceae archaeon]
MMNTTVFIIMTILFLTVTMFLGWYGYRQTRGSDEFLLGTRKISPVILALSYGATFLSASAIVGFGGQAAKYGMSLVWLVFLNLFVGLVVAFTIFGKPTRRLGKKLGAYTFSDLLGKRFESPSIRTLSALIILVGMPIYCAAVMLGGVNFLEAVTGINRNIALLVFALITALYVTYGGIIAVIYNDALQAGVMFIGMAVILIFTYLVLGNGSLDIFGVNSNLSNLWDVTLSGSGKLQALSDSGMNGWTSFSTFGSDVWLTVVTTFLLGVGIGALAQPQLVARFMTASDDRSMTKSLVVGSIFMLVIVGSAYTVGALTNVYFYNEYGQVAIDYVSNVDMIMPTFVIELFSGVTFGDIFTSLFVLALLCASISTMSALLHTMGVSGGYDLWSQIQTRRGKIRSGTDVHSLKADRTMTLVMTFVVVVVAFYMPENIIAKATSIFMGLTAATLLPAYAYCLFCKGKPNVNGARLSIIVGSVSWAFWAFFVNGGIANMIGLCHVIFGVNTLLAGPLTFVDPLIIGLPLSVIALIIGCMIKPSCSGSAGEMLTKGVSEHSD